MDSSRQPDGRPDENRRFIRIDWILLVLVVAVAAVFRLYRIDALPPGLWRDEAGYALAAKDVMNGVLQVYWGDKEPFFPYVLAGVFAVFGATPIALRVTAAVFGVLTVGATFLLGRVLLGRYGGLIAALCLATVFWHLDLSRVGFRVITMPLAITLCFYCFWQATRHSETAGAGRSLPWWIAAGLLAGFAPYTYLAARMTPVVLMVFFCYLALTGRRTLTDSGRGWIGLGIVAVFAFLPLGVFYALNPSYFFDRAGQLSPFGAAHDLPGVLAIAGKGMLDTAGMFFVHGDIEPRHNLPGRPVFDPMTALLFLLGIGVALRERTREHVFLLVWLVLLLVPSSLAVDNPHFLRTLGASPSAVMLVALGAISLPGTVRAAGLPQFKWWRAAAVVWIVVAAAWTARDYFLVWGSSELVAEFFEADVAAEARLIAASPKDAGTFASAPFIPHTSIQFLAPDRPDPLWFSGDEGVATLPGRTPAPGAVYGLTASNGRTLRLLQQLYPNGSVRPGSNGPDGRPLAMAYDIPGGTEAAWPAPARAIDVRFGNVLELRGPGPSQSEAVPGADVPVSAYWRVLRATDRPDLAFFVHLVDPAGATRGQHDITAFPSGEWRGGEMLATWFSPKLDSAAPAGLYRVLLGVYPRSNLQRLPVFPGGSVVAAGDTIEIGSFKVAAKPPTSKPSVAIGANFGGAIQLDGIDLAPDGGSTCDPKSLRPPCSLSLALYWTSLRPVGEDFTVFVHFLGQDGRPIVQADGQPVGGAYPTSIWSPGETVLDRHEFAIPAGIGAGSYRIVAGLYRVSDGVRLASSGGDSVELATVAVSPP